MKYQIILAAALLLTACNRDKTAEVGTEGMNAAANAASDAAANPTIDNPNVVSENEAPNPNAPVMKFTEAEFDFGDIKADSKVHHTFTFTNTGKSPLLIEDATASCGCTTPSWTKAPVLPGGQGTMEVQFDSRGKHGIISKQVAVRANTQPNITTILIKGNVLDAAKGANPL
ncbi:hypothetical protein AUC43_04185 [Hymenobacter sedentarius]|uniref:DUF1573 domain-containing protein n=1 Tax=Hymenobacter sedentarius TaxID=1411621 RepID=A0A0U4ALK1_9BACT|nr:MULTISPECIES: DUF1573 domain-containing protein [Hymenobacter]ALW84357.1 hypothetical protein AUC43_04185 [Hymenobacter sedentarius]MCC3153354.1 DUF1573 domain-containing protein [Hymenobacter sp. BT770]MDO3415564.1 DUF1573 domain-containing protein [Hymenobacter sp. BT770]